MENKATVTLSLDTWRRMLAYPDSPFVGEPPHLRHKIDARRVVVSDGGRSAKLQLMWRGNPVSEVDFKRFTADLHDCETLTIDISKIDASIDMDVVL